MRQNLLKEIKLALEVIKKRISSESKMGTFEFSFEEFIPEKAQPVIKGVTNFATENERLKLRNLFQRIQKESKSDIRFTFPESEKLHIGSFGLSPLELREAYKPIFYIHIENIKKLNNYSKIINGKLAGKSLFILTGNGELYRTNDKRRKSVYPMNPSGLRYRIVYYLAKEKIFVPTKDLAVEFETSPIKIRKTIGEVKSLIKNKLGVLGDEIIESKLGSGYRIQNIKLKEG